MVYNGNNTIIVNHDNMNRKDGFWSNSSWKSLTHTLREYKNILSKVKTESFSWYCKRGSLWKLSQRSLWPRLYLLSSQCCPPSISQHCNFSKFHFTVPTGQDTAISPPPLFSFNHLSYHPAHLIESHSPHSISPWRWRQHIPPKHSYPSIRSCCVTT
jgi:hypothetical protein